MDPITLLSATVLGLMLVVTAWNLASAPRLSRPVRGAGTRAATGAEERGARAPLPRVSVLVPARNEAANLETTLPALLRTEYPDLEILVLDDRSDDATAAAARRLAADHVWRGGADVRVIEGRPLPHGWVGKSWACDQLAEAATGEVLVFCDADVAARPEAVARTVAAMRETDSAALTALPRQRTSGWLESAVVPLVTQLPVLALLPLALVPRTRTPSLSMGNGQWIAFTREAYESIGGHAAVRGSLLEDVELARRVKRSGHRLLVTLAPDLLEVRMYRTPGEMRDGFVKNLHVLGGRTPAARAAALAVFALAAVHPWIGAAAGAEGAWICLVLLAALRATGVLLLRHEPQSVLLHPAGSIAVVYLAFASWAAARRGGLRWKGRGVSPVREPETVTTRNV